MDLTITEKVNTIKAYGVTLEWNYDGEVAMYSTDDPSDREDFYFTFQESDIYSYIVWLSVMDDEGYTPSRKIGTLQLYMKAEPSRDMFELYDAWHEEWIDQLNQSCTKCQELIKRIELLEARVGI